VSCNAAYSCHNWHTQSKYPTTKRRTSAPRWNRSRPTFPSPTGSSCTSTGSVTSTSECCVSADDAVSTRLHPVNRQVSDHGRHCDPSRCSNSRRNLADKTMLSAENHTGQRSNPARTLIHLAMGVQAAVTARETALPAAELMLIEKYRRGHFRPRPDLPRLAKRVPPGCSVVPSFRPNQSQRQLQMEKGHS